MSLTVSQISKTFGASNAVDNISFAIHTGEVVGFLGPNGAGKSTTMKMIVGFLQGSNNCFIKVFFITNSSLSQWDVVTQNINLLGKKNRISYIKKA